MAKKGNRMLIGLVCEVCKNQNYVTEKNKIKTTDKLEFTKYCKYCKKRNTHKEKPKLK